MKSLLPWVVALLLLGAAALLFSQNRTLSTEVAALQAEVAQTKTLQAEVEQLKSTGSPDQAAEITRLRKSSEEVLVLRNKVRQLTDGNKELTRQAQAEQARVAAAQSQIENLSTNLQAARVQSQQALAQGQFAAGIASANSCINNLRMIDGAKQQWALENRKDASVIPADADLTPYLKGGIPKCPMGGTYTFNNVGALPKCTVAGHALPE